MAKYKVNRDLLEFAKTASNETIKAAGVSREYLRLVSYGHKQMSAIAASRLETATHKRFLREDLRGDWVVIWPELLHRARYED